jgi:hypothetical protein
MSLKLGNVNIGSLYLGSTKISEAYLGSVKILSSGSPQIPAKTIRFDFKYDHFDPRTMRDSNGIGATWTHVRDDIYDFYYNNTNWGSRKWKIGGTGGLFNNYAYMNGSSTVYPMTQHKFDIIDMNLDGVTDVSQLISSAWRVMNIFSIRNSGSVTNFSRFLAHASRQVQYTSIPLFDTSSAVDVSNMCRDARYVTTGALALYNQMSTQAIPPSNYNNCFTNCGINSTTGAEELAQIPTSWGGKAS